MNNTICFKEHSFVFYIVAATVLNFIVLINTYINLASVETFFIDWERARFIDESKDTALINMPLFQTDSSSSILQKTSNKQNSVVIW